MTISHPGYSSLSVPNASRLMESAKRMELVSSIMRFILSLLQVIIASKGLNLLPSHYPSFLIISKGVRTADLDMYAESLIYAYEHPQHKGTIKDAEASMQEENISCGDKITVYLGIEKGVVKDVKFDGIGCVISMGSADLLAAGLKGKRLDEVLKFGQGELLRLIGIDPGPVRMHCATLSLRAIKEALFAYAKKPVDSATKEL